MCYEEHKKKYPDESVQVTEISKRCSEKWKTMSEDEKKRFYELAQKDAERYNAEVQAYGGEDTTRRKKKQKKDPNAPKKALSAFFFFSNERRPQVQQEHPDWKVGTIAQELGKAWKALSEEERAVYERKAAEDKARYDEASSLSLLNEMRNYRGGGDPHAGNNLTVGQALADPQQQMTLQQGIPQQQVMQQQIQQHQM
ncbi:High mobility group protein 1.2 [Aphelenchoides avenae]|nr:High mobility group protein 1.2 [Aphelenchus avenae]